MPPTACPSIIVALSPILSRLGKIALLILLSTAVSREAWSQSGIAASGTGSNFYSSGTYTPTVTTNVPIREIPEPLYSALTSSSQTRWQDGYLDITQPPYGASPNNFDNSCAIQKAIHDGFYYNFTVYVPSGTYSVRKALSCSFAPPYPLDANLKFCNVLVGSGTGTGGRSVIKYTGTGTVNPLILFQYLLTGTSSSGEPDATRQYGSTFRSIDIDMGDHAASDAISMTGAQNCDIEDVTISGSAFNAGISGIPASGGSVNNVTVIGGKYGILSSNYRPSPVLCGITLIGQSVNGVNITNSRGPISIVGFNISNTTAPAGFIGVSVTGSMGGAASTDPKGHTNLIDGQITVSGTGGIGVRNYASHSNIAMQNVYIKAATLIQSGTFTITGTTGAYNHLGKYVFVTGSSQAAVYDQDGCFLIPQPSPTVDFQDADAPVLEDPPTDLVSNHVGKPLLFLDSANTFSATAAMFGTNGATPDLPGNDDAIGINNVIAHASGSNPVVVLPRGHYHIKSPIRLRDGVSLLGGGKNSSVLQIVRSNTWNTDDQTTFFTVESNTDSPPKGVSLQDFGILGLVATTATTSSTTAPNNMKNVTLLRIQNPNVTMHDVVTTKYVADGDAGADTEGSAPVVVMDTNAGGHFYDLCLFKFEATLANSDYHLLQIRKTTNPIYLYAPSIEHEKAGGAQIQIDCAQNVHCIGLKAEGMNQLIRLTNSINCSVFGASSEFSSTNSIPLVQLDSHSDRLWFSLLDRLIKDKNTASYPWVASGTNSLISGTVPVGLFKQGLPVVLGNGFTETFSGSSNFVLSGTNYSYSRDDTEYPCLNFTGTGSPAIYCTQTRFSTTNGYQVSVMTKMTTAPVNNRDTPTLIFLSSPVFKDMCHTAYTAKIEADGTLVVEGPDTSRSFAVPPLWLNSGTGGPTSQWNQLAVRVRAGNATVLINGNQALSFAATGLATALDTNVQAQGNPISFGLTGRNGEHCSFENFGYYPER